MKKLLILLLLVISNNILPQTPNSPKVFSSFNFEILGGINFGDIQYIGPSLIIEGKTNITSNLNIKFSLGYSTTFKKDETNIKTYNFISIDNIEKYSTLEYTREKIEYQIIPISAGLEYFFKRKRFSPYGFLEFGYNSYRFKEHLLSNVHNIAGSFDTFDELPADFKNKPPVIFKPGSYKIAIGIGTNYKISPSISLDIRYSFQYNKFLVNTNQILLGISF